MIGDQILHFFEFFYYFLMHTVVRKLKLHFWGPKRRFFEIMMLPMRWCPGFPGQNRIRLVLPFPKIQRTRESDTRSQSYGCLKFFLTVELWKFITNCRKIQINWNLCQFYVFFNALHAGVLTFSVWSLYQSRLADLPVKINFDIHIVYTYIIYKYNIYIYYQWTITNITIFVILTIEFFYTIMHDASMTSAI